MATKKRTTRKKTANTSTATRSTTKKSTKKAPARKSAAKKSAPREEASSNSSSRSAAAAPRAQARTKRTGMQIAQEAARQLLELTGREAEGVVAMERTDDGWRIEVEVVEVRRIPDTTDVLALYEVTVDEDGDMEGYRRLRRYGRGVPGEERDR
jgi:hypothetical protein